MLHFILKLHALEKHCKKKKEEETWSSQKVPFSTNLFPSSGSTSGFNLLHVYHIHLYKRLWFHFWSSYLLSKLCLWFGKDRALGNEMGMGWAQVLRLPQRGYCSWRWQEVREQSHVLLQCLSYLTDKAHAGTGDKIQRSTLSYINL